MEARACTQAGEAGSRRACRGVPGPRPPPAASRVVEGVGKAGEGGGGGCGRRDGARPARSDAASAAWAGESGGGRWREAGSGATAPGASVRGVGDPGGRAGAREGTSRGRGKGSRQVGLSGLFPFRGGFSRSGGVGGVFMSCMAVVFRPFPRTLASLTMTGRSMSCFNRPDRHRVLHRARRAVRCCASRMKGERRPAQIRL